MASRAKNMDEGADDGTSERGNQDDPPPGMAADNVEAILPVAPCNGVQGLDQEAEAHGPKAAEAADDHREQHHVGVLGHAQAREWTGGGSRVVAVDHRREILTRGRRKSAVYALSRAGSRAIRGECRSPERTDGALLPADRLLKIHLLGAEDEFERAVEYLFADQGRRDAGNESLDLARGIEGDRQEG